MQASSSLATRPLVQRLPLAARPCRRSSVAPAAISKRELVGLVAEKTMMSKREAELAVNAVIDTIVEEVTKGEKVTITGFGAFEPKDRSARKGRNPQTGEELHIPATRVPSFTAGKSFKEAVKASLKSGNGAATY